MTQMSKTLDEVPLGMIRDAQATHPEVNLQIKRANSKGQWSTVGSRIRKPIAECASLEDFISQHCGGGKFRVHATDPSDPTVEVLPPFYVEIEGRAVPPTFTQEIMAPGATPGYHGDVPYAQGGAPIPQPPPRHVPPSAWAMGLAPSQQAAYMASLPSPYPNGQPGYDPNHRMDRTMTRYTADELAKQNSDRLEKELHEVRAQAERDRREFINKLDAMTKESQARIDVLLDKLEDERRASRDREMEAKMLALRAEFSSSKSTQPDMISNIVALTPLLQTFITSSREREATAASQQTRMMETMFTRKDDGFMTQLIPLLPVLAPLVMNFFNSRGPEAQAKLIEQMSEQQLTFLGMAAQLVQSQIEAEAEAEGAKGKLVPVLEQILGGAMQLGQAWLQGKQLDDLEQLPPELRQHKLRAMNVDEDTIREIENGIRLKQQANVQRNAPVQQLVQSMATRQAAVQPQQQPQVAVQPQPKVVEAEVVEVVGDDEFTADEQERIRKADRLVQQQLKNPMVPQAFKTPEWSRLLVLVHAQLDPDGVAEELAEHLDALADKMALPDVLSDFHTSPRATLAKVFLFLPIQKESPGYVKKLLDAIDRLYEEGNDAEAIDVAPPSNGSAAVAAAAPVIAQPNFDEAPMPTAKS